MNPEKTLLQKKEAEPRYSLVSEHAPGIYKALIKSSVLKRTKKDEQEVKTDKWEREGSTWRESGPQVYPVFPPRSEKLLRERNQAGPTLGWGGVRRWQGIRRTKRTLENEKPPIDRKIKNKTQNRTRLGTRPRGRVRAWQTGSSGLDFQYQVKAGLVAQACHPSHRGGCRRIRISRPLTQCVPG